jgi:NAD(P)-dependent dehydrogenase (short-subunit alcohol dehydrogenase family)
LASLLSAPAVSDARSLLVPLGSSDPAVPALYCVHPAGGGVYMYEPLSRHLAPHTRVIGIARSANPALAERARAKNAWLDWYLQDFADVGAVEALARSIGSGLPRDATRYVLVNNAGVAEPLGPIATLGAAEVAACIDVNLTSAFVFTSRFLEATAPFDAERRVLNISSGLARRPMDGSAAYCAAKAGLDMLTRCINSEPDDPARAKRRAKSVALAPGVIDTDMQGVLRGRDRAAFPEGARFAAFKAEGQLATANDVAKKIAAFVARDDFGTTELDDIRNY